VDQIQELEEKYPYSQIMHVLTAVGSKKFKHPEAAKKLTTAAVYATDRTLLKEIISSVGKKLESPTEEGESLPKDSVPDPTKNISSSIALKKDLKSPVSEPTLIIDKERDLPGPLRPLSESDAEKLRIEVMKNLEDLLVIKKFFYEDHSAVKKVKGKSPSKSKASGDSRRSKIVKNGRTISPSPATQKTETTVPKKITKATTPKISAKKISSTFKSVSIKKPGVAKASVKPETKKTIPKKKTTAKSNKEQQKLIDNFIKKEPTIKKKKADEKMEKNDDLAKSSVSFGDDLVSENLARMMIKQGKTGKAIDIYKKLIWKFPQKKAYFASQIESLKGK